MWCPRREQPSLPASGWHRVPETHSPQRSELLCASVLLPSSPVLIPDAVVCTSSSWWFIISSCLSAVRVPCPPHALSQGGSGPAPTGGVWPGPGPRVAPTGIPQAKAFFQEPPCAASCRSPTARGRIPTNFLLVPGQERQRASRGRTQRETNVGGMESIVPVSPAGCPFCLLITEAFSTWVRSSLTPSNPGGAAKQVPDSAPQPTGRHALKSSCVLHGVSWKRDPKEPIQGTYKQGTTGRSFLSAPSHHPPLPDILFSAKPV